MFITKDIKYIGVNDHKVDLFEGQYVVPNGMAYNSYVILDEKIAEGKSVSVLFESWSDGYAKGHTADFIEVKVRSDKALHSVFRNVILLSHDGDICEAKFAD